MGLKIINRKQIKILTPKHSLIKIKDSIVKNNSRRDIAAKGISELEDRSEKIATIEQRETKGWRIQKENIKDRHEVKMTYIHVIGVSK